MTHLDQDPDPPVEGSEYRDHMRVHRTDPFKRVKAFVLPDTLVNVLVLRRMWAERDGINHPRTPFLRSPMG